MPQPASFNIGISNQPAVPPELLEELRQLVTQSSPEVFQALPPDLQQLAYTEGLTSPNPNLSAMIGRALSSVPPTGQPQPLAPLGDVGPMPDQAQAQPGPSLGDMLRLPQGQPMADAGPMPPAPTWGQRAAGMAIRTVPAVAGAALGGPVGAFVGGAAGEALGELYEGRSVNPLQVGVQGALGLLPGVGATGGATRLGLSALESAGESAIANSTIGQLMRSAATGAIHAPVATMGSNWAEGRPLTEGMATNVLLGGALGAGTHGAIEAVGAAAPHVASAVRDMGATIGDFIERNPRLADETGAVGRVGSLALPPKLRALKRSMDERQWNTLVTQAEAVPGARDALAHLQPAEIEPLTRSAGAMENFVDTFKRLPDVDYLVAAIKRGAPKRRWYENSRRALQALFQDDADMFTGVLAATSPQTSVESNLINALNIFVNWKAAGRPTDAGAIKAIINRSVQGGSESSALDAWIDNTVRVLQGGQSISGPKIDQFWLALRNRALENKLGRIEPHEAMVLDAWMANVMGAAQENWSGNLTAANRERRLAMGDPGVTPYYLAGVARMRQAAAKAGVSGAEAQEMAWSTAMALYEKASTLGIPAREVLERGLLTDADVAGTPDFSSLLRQDMFASILNRDPQLAAVLPKLAELPHSPGDVVSMTPRETQQLQRVADTLDSLRQMRRIDTAVETPDRPAGQLAAVVPMEAVTDPQWSSLLPHTTTSAQSPKVNQVFGAREDLRQQSTILDMLTGGSRTGSRMRGQGYWKDSTGDVQKNAVSSYGVAVPVNARGKVPQAIERGIRVAGDVDAMLTGQSAAAHIIINPNTPPATHDAVAIYAGRKLKKPEVDAFSAALEAIDPQYRPVQSGRAVRIIRVTDQGTPVTVSPADIAQIQQLASEHLSTTNAKGKVVAPKMETGTNIATNGYRPVSEGAEAGSGKRVDRVVGKGSEWAQLPPAQQKRLDVRAREMAGRLLRTYDMPRVRKERPDEATMLETVASSGLTGLAKALGAGAVLPAIGLLGLSLGDETK